MASKDTQIFEGENVDQTHDRYDTQILDNGDVDKIRNEMIEHGPRSGMKFESRESLFQAYQDFAKVQGFCVSFRNFQGDKYFMISCDKARKPNVKKRKKRMDCHARMNAIKQDNGYWKVSIVHLTHNHDLDPNIQIISISNFKLSKPFVNCFYINDHFIYSSIYINFILFLILRTVIKIKEPLLPLSHLSHQIEKPHHPHSPKKVMNVSFSHPERNVGRP